MLDMSLMSSLLLLTLVIGFLILILRKLLHEDNEEVLYCYLCRSTLDLRRGIDYRGNVYILCERCREKIVHGLR